MAPDHDTTFQIANGIRIAYDSFGLETDPPLLLIAGLGQQLLAWEEDFCRALASRGFRVIRFDNRDVGRSTWVEEAGLPDMGALLRLVAGKSVGPVKAPYTLSDMARDALGVLEGLGLKRAHVVGMSMGGMIAQKMAILHPERLLTLTSIMSSTGEEGLPPPRPEALELLGNRPPLDRVGYVEDFVGRWRVLHGPVLPYEEERYRRLGERSFERGLNPPGFARQLAAIHADGSRRDALSNRTVPTLVIHGDADPLVPVACGRATAAAVPGSELLIIEGMGHTLPATAWPRLIEAIARHAKTQA